MKIHLIYISSIIILVVCLVYSVYMALAWKSLAWQASNQTDKLYDISKGLLQNIKDIYESGN